MDNLVIGVSNFLFKLAATVFVLWASHIMMVTVLISTWIVFTTAMVVAILGVVIDYTILPAIGNWRSVLTDFVINTLVIWLFPAAIYKAPISPVEAMLSAAVIGILEYFIHRFVLRTYRLERKARQV